jgi:hypothetical protein
MSPIQPTAVFPGPAANRAGDLVTIDPWHGGWGIP